MDSNYLAMPDGSICWEPSPEDFVLFRDEERDLSDTDE